MDNITKAQRSVVMEKIRSDGNRSTEWRLRAVLIRLGIKGWRVRDKNLPGTPDFVFPARKLAVFVDGCFWHGCPKCYRRPKSSRKYWDSKALLNRSRDERNARALRRIGWSVRRVWEHQLSEKPSSLVVSLTAIR
ncbi:MAG: very short patch repair endonuclease [Elusimicrobia bacterium]|nr:very short patch repair endonuclease [Elusimicrobiota bacterium]